MASIAPAIEDRGIDEIYIDLTEFTEDSETLARRIKAAVREATGLSASIGITPNKLLAKIPFELTGSFIVVEVSINNSTPLRMILDSGLRNTLITEIFPSDSINLIPGEIRELQGLGSGITYKAYESTGNQIKIGKIKASITSSK